MKQTKMFSKKKWVILGFSTFLLGFSHSVFASGFQLFEENGTSTGDFGAGGAASANDASTAFFNPAGLVRIKGQQLVLSADTIASNLNYKGSTTLSTPPFGSSTQSGSAQGGSTSVVPGFNYAAPINSSVVFGLSATVPFGLESNYSENSFLAYAATKTSVEVIDLSPVLGLQLTKALSFGFGPDFDYVNAELDSVGGVAGAPQFNTTSKNTASGWGLGWHAGFLYQFTQATRMGLAYHSKVTADVDGTSKFTGPLASFTGPGQFSTDALSSSVALPPTTMLSLFHRVNNAWALMGTVAYTQWGVFNNLELNNVQGVTGFPPVPAQTNVNLPQNFRNTWRFAVGAMYQPFQKWEFTAGTGYDETPTVDQYRNVRLPDGNRFALAAGIRYQATKTLGLDVGYTHLFIQKVPINITQQYGGESVTTNGHEESSADIIGLQLTWNIT